METIKIKYKGQSIYTKEMCDFLEYEFNNLDLINKLEYGIENTIVESWGAFLKFNNEKIASTIQLNLSKEEMSRFERETEYIFNNRENSFLPIYKNVYMQIFSKHINTDKTKNNYEVQITFFTLNNK